MIAVEQARATLPYGRHWVDEDDIQAVVEVLRSDWLTTGPGVAEFESDIASAAGAAEAVAVNSGTAALHAIMHALEVGPGDEVIVPALTFAASANAVLYCGARPVFCDVEPDTLLINPADLDRRITPKTRAVVAVDYAGQPCDYGAIRQVTESRRIRIVADACHSLGGADCGRPVGTLAEMNAFSFHPVKPVTTGEGGAVATDDPQLAKKMRAFRNHGITSDHRQRAVEGSWFYEMQELGFNYRMSDIQCALGRSQLRKLSGWTRRRQELAGLYDAGFRKMPRIQPLGCRPEVSHAYHLYVVRLETPEVRARVFQELRSAGIHANVHYVPVYLHPYYQRELGTRPGLCPTAEDAFSKIVSLPIFPRMDDADVARVLEAVSEAVAA